VTVTVQVSVTAEQYGTFAPLAPVGLTGEYGVDFAEVLTEGLTHESSSSSSSQTVGMALTEVQTLVELDEVTV
jgi:hypothetical protein